MLVFVMAARRVRYGFLVQVLKTKIRMEGLCLLSLPANKALRGSGMELLGWSYWKQASLIVERRLFGKQAKV